MYLYVHKLQSCSKFSVDLKPYLNGLNVLTRDTMPRSIHRLGSRYICKIFEIQIVCKVGLCEEMLQAREIVNK